MNTAQKIKRSSKGAYYAKKKASEAAVSVFRPYMDLDCENETYAFKDGSKLHFNGSKFWEEDRA